MSDYTPLDEIPTIRDAVKAGFAAGKTRDVAYRKAQLLQLAHMVKDNAERMVSSLREDLSRPRLETYFLELSAVVTEAVIAYKKVDKWAAPEGVPFSITTSAMFGKVYKQPKGVVLIIGPFNYPYWCTLTPLIGAIAAGCTVVVKPSELSGASMKLLVELFPKYLDQDCYRIVTGAIPETTKLLELQWDHIMYTGSNMVGKVVAAAAAKHLTPITLELGGKSPVIVDNSANITLTARRVLWAKMANAGQTCVAPDYILVAKDKHDALVEALLETYEQFYPKADGGPAESTSFGRLVNQRHFERVQKVLDRTKGEVVAGGETNAATKYIAPTIVKNVSLVDSLMEEELFGPVLPIIPVDNFQQAVDYVNSRDHPLALYLFCNDQKVKASVLRQTQSGMAMVNDLIISAGVEGLGFGGIGPSGMGAHSDRTGFEQFTHRRSTIHVPAWLDLIMKFRFPPYSPRKESTALALLMPNVPRGLSGTSSSSFNWLLWGPLIAIIGAAAGALTKKQAISSGK